MTSVDLLPAALLARKAIVYVRQSTQSQVMTNLEGQRRQYDLVDIARQRGFRDVEVTAGPSKYQNGALPPKHLPPEQMLPPEFPAVGPVTNDDAVLDPSAKWPVP